MTPSADPGGGPPTGGAPPSAPRADPAADPPSGTQPDDPTGFEPHRAVLTAVAYRMLGVFADAEDVVQEAWLRWSAVDRGTVADPRGYLVRTTTRLALDRLRAAASRRESYTGPWLPEPVPTASPAVSGGRGAAPPDAALRAELQETVSLAVLVVLETLSPLERAVFVLREAFGYPFAEIAAILDRGEPAVRQLATRARRHVAERRPRFDPDPDARRRLTERFLAAAAGSDLDGLLALLSDEVRLVGDGGGKTKAPLRVMTGADKVARFLVAISQQTVPGAEFAFTDLNGDAALLITAHGEPWVVFAVDVEDDRISTLYLMGNPDKLTALRRAAAAGREDEGAAPGA